MAQNMLFLVVREQKKRKKLKVINFCVNKKYNKIVAT